MECNATQLSLPSIVSNPFEQIGPKLKVARESKGLDLAEAAKHSQIPHASIEALEKEDFSYFDSPVYARSFLLQYSEFLDVDAQTWLEALKPGSFIASGALLKGPEEPTRRMEKAGSQTKGGGVSVIILLMVTAGIICAVIKGIEYFESKQDPKPPSGETR